MDQISGYCHGNFLLQHVLLRLQTSSISMVTSLCGAMARSYNKMIILLVHVFWNLVQAYAHLSLLSMFPSPRVPGPPTRWQPCGGRNHSTPWRPPSRAICHMLPAETPPSGGSQNQLQKKEESQMHIVNTGDLVQDRNGVKSWKFLSGIVNKCKAKQNLSVS